MEQKTLEGIGILPFEVDHKLEKPLAKNESKMSEDWIEFQGTNSEGSVLVIALGLLSNRIGRAIFTWKTKVR